MYGKLGHGNEAGHSTPKRVEALVGLNVNQIACGSRHTAVITTTGAMYTWYVIKMGHDASFLSCGRRPCVFSDRRHFHFPHFRGDKENGVAGHGDTDGHQYTPKLLERLAGKRVVQLSACGFHTGCLTAEGELFTW
jgi:RCC1 and BTB domain-containing protein